MSTQKQHPIEYLFNEQKKLPYCRYGVKPVPKMLAGTAFFPGGSGLWLGYSGSWYTPSDRPDMPEGKVMVLGHNFDSEAGYKCTESSDVQHELDSPTWQNLLPLLQAAGIDKKDCFFTNAYMGLKAGEKNTGEFPGMYDLGFVQRCESFFLEQIAVQKPCLVLVLGKHSIKFIAGLSSDLNKWKPQGLMKWYWIDYKLSPNLIKWKSWPGFKKFNDEASWIDGVHFNGSNPTTVVALVHPSMRKSNAKKLRHYFGKEKEDPELEMLRDAWEQSKLQ